MFKMGVFYHLVSFAWGANNKKIYRVAISFASATEMEAWVEKNAQGIGLWVVPSREDNLPTGEEVGGQQHVCWTGHQWSLQYMNAAPVFGAPYIKREEVA